MGNYLMIKLSDVTKEKLENLTPQIRSNLAVLLAKINLIEKEYGKPFFITSGLRSMEDHLRIYKQKGITDPAKIPMQSKHLFGQAVDVSDPKQELKKWCLENIVLLEKAGLWCEDFSTTSNWIHFQIVAPSSKKRFFLP